MGVFGFDALVHARQVGRQCFALGLAAGLTVGCIGARGGVWSGVWSGALQGRELSLQAGLVGGERLLEVIALLGVHALGLGAELPALQQRQPEGDVLDLRVTPLDGLRLRVDPLVLLANVSALFADVFALLANVSQHLRCDYRQFASAERFDVLDCDRVQIEHAHRACSHCAKPEANGPLGLLPIALNQPRPTLSHSRNAAQLLKPLPWQSEYQGVD